MYVNLAGNKEIQRFVGHNRAVTSQHMMPHDFTHRLTYFRGKSRDRSAKGSSLDDMLPHLSHVILLRSSRVPSNIRERRFFGEIKSSWLVTATLHGTLSNSLCS